MYVAWAFGVGFIATYGLMTTLWQALAISFVLQACFMLGQVIWTTMLQQLVPRELLGRVSSLDWMMSLGLVPVSYALTGPVSGALGPDATMVVAGADRFRVDVRAALRARRARSRTNAGADGGAGSVPV